MDVYRTNVNKRVYGLVKYTKIKRDDLIAGHRKTI